MNATQAIQELHDRCAVYTAAPTAAKLLDLAGWKASIDLSRSRLLEPCVGEGVILFEAVERLLASLKRQDIEITLEILADRIISYEIHGLTALATRATIESQLRSAGVSPSDAIILSRRWVRKGDFLLSEIGEASHVVANPPYVRWSKLPKSLAGAYRAAIREVATRGDLAVAFIDRMLDWAGQNGSVIALVSDRWMFAQYGAAFVDDIAGRGWEIDVLEERPTSPFVRDVAAYSAIVSFRRDGQQRTRRIARQDERQLHEQLVARHGILLDAGCVVRVGPALGAGRTYILKAEDAEGIEQELLRPYLGREDLTRAPSASSGLVVACPYDAAGKPIDLVEWPGFARWAKLHKGELEKRSCIRSGGAWWRTIDAIGPQWSVAPKLIIPELCQRPVAYMDKTTSIPAHSLYVIWSTAWPTASLQRVLNAGLMRITAEACAPQLNHGYYRFYRRFLTQTPLPQWTRLTPQQQKLISDGDRTSFARCFMELFGFAPDRE